MLLTIVLPDWPVGSEPPAASDVPAPAIASARLAFADSESSRYRSVTWLLVWTSSSISSSIALYSSSASPTRSWRIVAEIRACSVSGALPTALRMSWSLVVPSIELRGVEQLEPRRVPHLQGRQVGRLRGARSAGRPAHTPR